MYINNNKKDTLVFGKDPAQGLGDTTITAEAEYSIDFSRLQRKFSLNLHYTGGNSFLFVNATKTNQFKAKDSKIKLYPLCLENILKDFAANIIKKGYLYDFSVDYNIIDNSNVVKVGLSPSKKNSFYLLQ